MKSNQYSYTITDKSVTLFENARPFIAKSDHPNFKKIRELIKKSNFSEAVKLFDIVENIKNLNPKIEIKNNSVYYDGKIQHNYVANRILAFLKEGFDIKPLVKFLENLYQNPLVKDNPNHYLIEDLYKFLETNEGMPITEDGCFLAWKRVHKDGFDIHSQTIKYEVGKYVEESFDKVDKNRDNTCSYGLHFCSKTYLEQSGFGSGENSKMLLVKVNPAWVCSIPTDYNRSKGRAYKMFVYAEYEENSNPKINKTLISKNYQKRDSSGRFCK